MIVTRLLAVRSGVAARSRRTIWPLARAVTGTRSGCPP